MIGLQQQLHADIMFVNGEAFLIVVLNPLSYTCIKHLSSGRHAHVLWDALAGVLADLKAHGFRATALLSDGEGGIARVKDKILGEGLQFSPAGPAQHVPVVETKIKTIKERVRAVLSGLPYSLPANLLPYLVYYCATRVNMAPSSLRSDKASPRELFTGRKIDYATDLRVSFGDYVQCTTRSQE